MKLVSKNYIFFYFFEPLYKQKLKVKKENDFFPTFQTLKQTEKSKKRKKMIPFQLFKPLRQDRMC